jgi:hypothetical protein
MADYSDPLGLLFGGVDYFGSPQKSKGLLQLTPQEIERMAAAQSPAFGVFPQMQPYRSQQDITASANVPVDVARGRVAGTLGLFGDVFNQPIPMVRPLQLLSQAMTGQQKYPDTEYFLENLPLKSDTPVGDVAGRVASFAPINPMPAVRGAQKLGGLLGEEMATRLNTGRPILPSLLAEPQTAMFAVNPAEQAMTSGLLQAEVSPLGFYSAVEQQALKIPRKQGTGESFLNDLLKGQDVKKYEIEAMGLDTYLKGKPNVTRQEVQDFIANNRVDVQEVRYGALTSEDQAQKDLLNNRYRQLTDQIETAKLRYEEGGIPYSELRKTMSDISKERTGIEESLSSFQGEAPKFGQYQLAGGENYRELVFTLPENMSEYNKYVKTLRDKYGQGGFDNLPLTDIERARLDKFYAAEELDPYKSSHFPDIKNPLAHMRVNDRVDAEGKKMLLIEEVQSDWHQAGREKGYDTPERRMAKETALNNLLAERSRLLDEQQRLEELAKPFTSIGKDAPANIIDQWSIVSNRLQNLQTEQNRLGRTSIEGVPDAPFKDTWYQLALKRAIKEAVDKGYDRIGLTTGAQQAARYDLSKQVDELNYKRNDDGTYQLSAQANGRGNMLGETVPEEKLSDYVGKEVAEKITKNEGFDRNFGGTGSVSQPKDIWKGLSGLDLKIGGEGMKKYYDEIYPNFLNKYGKKYGAQVGETEIGLPQKTSSSWAYFRDWFAENHSNVGGSNTALSNWEQGSNNKYVKEFEKFRKTPTQKETVRYLDITPEMKKAVQKGQPLAAVEGMTGLLA